MIPVGDFKSVIRYYDRNRSLLPTHVKQWIVLDRDVEQESLQIMDASSNNPMRDAFHTHSAAIRYLPWTPEVGLARFLDEGRARIQQELRSQFANAFINIPSTRLNHANETDGPETRSESKSLIRDVVSNLCEQIGSMKEDTMLHTLYAKFAEHYFTRNRNSAMQLFGPLIS